MVNGVNVLSQLSTFSQASTGGVEISNVTGLSDVLAGKQAALSSSSALQLSELTCAWVKPATAILSLADSNGVERLGISAGSAVFSAPVSAPSLDGGGSIVCGSSAFVLGPLYLGGTDIMTTIAAGLGGKQATITTGTALSAGTVGATTGMTVTGGRGGVATNSAQLRVVSSNSSILAAPPQLTRGVNGEDHVAWEYNYLGFGSHFWRSSASNAWSENARVTS